MSKSKIYMEELEAMSRCIKAIESLPDWNGRRKLVWDYLDSLIRRSRLKDAKSRKERVNIEYLYNK